LHFSFTQAVTQELNHAINSKCFLTVAQLYGKLVQKTWSKGEGTLELDRMPVHAQLWPGPRTSIYLVPHITPSGAEHSAAANLNNIPSLNDSIRVFLSVSISDGNTYTLDDVASWLTLNKPSGVQSVEVKMLSTYATSACELVFFIPVEVWYCLESHPAIKFLAFQPSLDGQNLLKS